MKYQIYQYPDQVYELQQLTENCPNHSFKILVKGSLFECECKLTDLRLAATNKTFAVFGKLLREEEI